MNRPDHQKSNKTLCERIPYFMEHVMFEPNSGCWLWIGSVNPGGYGNFWHGGKCLKAHRFSHIAFIGPIPDGFDVMHKCDTPSCVNPSHLKAAATLENVRDCWAKGRGNDRSGVNNGNAKLVADKLVQACDMYRSGKLVAHIAEIMGMAHSSIYRVLRREGLR